MRVTHIPGDDEVRAERKRLYIEKWPVEKQMEAHAEHAAGRPEKLNGMMEDFAEIRGALPFFEKQEGK